MDANSKAPKTGDICMTENKRMSSPSDVVVMISEDDRDSKNPRPDVSNDWKPKLSVDPPAGAQNSAALNIPSPEIARYNPSSNKPPRIPTTETLKRRKSLARSVYSKPKSRFGEESVIIDANIFEEQDEQNVNSPCGILSTDASPNGKMISGDTNTTSKETTRSVPITPRTPLMAMPGVTGGVDDGEEIYKRVSSQKKLKLRRVKMMALIEWLGFLCILGCFIASLTHDKLRRLEIWSLEIWKWFLLVMVTFSGLLVTNWFMHFIVLLIELNFLFRKKVLYFVHGLKNSVQVFIWLSLVLVTWVLLFKDSGVNRSPVAKKILNYITWTIVSLLIGAFLWLLKTFLLKLLASSFNVNTFFDRIQEAIFHQYILLTLSGPPLLGRTSTNTSQLSFRRKKGKEGKGKKATEIIDINKLHQMKREKVSAWTMKMLVDVISNSGLSTLSGTLEESVYSEGHEQADKEITNEEEAIAAAYHIFRNVSQHGCKYIDEVDLRKFMLKEEVDLVFPMIDVAETGQIDRKALTDWVVKVYQGRKALAHALNDTKTAVKQLNKIVTGVLIVVMILVWLLLMEIATTKVLLLLSSQFVAAAFLFGNTCKMIFEAIIFVFVMHPFDVGDRCVVDGVQMIVEEMNILTTVFLRYDKEKIFYPNSILATKPISNFYRSPEMGDSFEFSIDFKTPMEKIGALKEKIKKYLDNSLLWNPNHSVVVKEIENINKIKMVLFFNHTINFQDIVEKNRRRSELVLEMKKIFEELGIKYDLPSQDVHLIDSRNNAAGTTR